MEAFERIAKPELTRLIDSISGYSGDQVIQYKESTETDKLQLYDRLLSELQVAETRVSSYISCIQKDILQRNDISSQLYNLQQEVEGTRTDLKEKLQIVGEAKERADQLEHPYNSTTWWESWFPLGRPVRKESVPVLLSVSIFMLVFSLGIFLRFAGMELRFESVGSTTNSLLKNLNSRKYP